MTTSAMAAAVRGERATLDLDRLRLLTLGIKHVTDWCALNGVKMPEIAEYYGKPQFSVCAYYRHSVIHIWPKRCALIGTAGRQWSYPGYTVDRTPYGVLAHELAHHVDGAHGQWGGKYGKLWRAMLPKADATPITGYCENDNEWFAEMFRVFVTNPDLLHNLRPQVFTLMLCEWPRLAEDRLWDEVLAGATRQLKAARRKGAL